MENRRKRSRRELSSWGLDNTRQLHHMHASVCPSPDSVSSAHQCSECEHVRLLACLSSLILPPSLGSPNSERSHSKNLWLTFVDRPGIWGREVTMVLGEGLLRAP